MGRAQVVQAEAAGIEPDVRMNPILLKPTSDSGSQVIVNGKAIGTMPAVEYYRYKKNLVPDIMEAFNSLSAENDVIVIEGAGSPAEINLKDQDIVNMGMARMAKAPVLLVADIDRGGVFASVYGTVMLLEPEERAMIKGIIINKFRGDVRILQPGLDMLEAKTGIPVLGVLPMLSVDIEDEDSLSDRLSSEKQRNALVDIAVIQVPRMSNYTDFNALEILDGVSVRYVRTVEELGNPDMIILPGTKNTIDDLKWMRQNGIEAAVLHKAASGTVVFGICGGYQMLGRKLSDPYGYDSGHKGSVIDGMGLLDTTTDFVDTKRTIQMQGRFGDVQGLFHDLSGKEFYGYEIHSGVTHLDPAHALTTARPINEEGEPFAEGSQNVHDNRTVYGTYMHGIFDAEGVAATVVEALLAKKGLSPDDVKVIDYQAYKEQQYDLLADSIRNNLDMKKVKEILERGI
jgi:adenosylcobyric acid synthase